MDEIVFKRLRDGQLDACGLTMTEVTKIREVFAKTLRSMLHSRIKYPKEKTEEPISDLSSKGKVVPIEEIEKVRREYQQGE